MTTTDLATLIVMLGTSLSAGAVLWLGTDLPVEVCVIVVLMFLFVVAVGLAAVLHGIWYGGRR